jgi:hypothetical protein
MVVGAKHGAGRIIFENEPVAVVEEPGGAGGRGRYLPQPAERVVAERGGVAAGGAEGESRCAGYLHETIRIKVFEEYGFLASFEWSKKRSVRSTFRLKVIEAISESEMKSEKRQKLRGDRYILGYF